MNRGFLLGSVLLGACSNASSASTPTPHLTEAEARLVEARDDAEVREPGRDCRAEQRAGDSFIRVTSELYGYALALPAAQGWAINCPGPHEALMATHEEMMMTVTVLRYESLEPVYDEAAHLHEVALRLGGALGDLGVRPELMELVQGPPAILTVEYPLRLDEGSFEMRELWRVLHAGGNSMLSLHISQLRPAGESSADLEYGISRARESVQTFARLRTGE